MKILHSLLLLVIGLGGVVLPLTGTARGEVSEDYFYRSLEPYGNWIDVDKYGYCWQPNNVAADWQPYTDGYWSYTDAGWTWISYEDFGDIVYHYGRWTYLDDTGWVWVPGQDWGPAWVSWRSNDEAIGWAPLPPEAVYRREVGIGVSVDAEFDIGPAWFSFVRIRDFGAPLLGPVIISRAENVTFIDNSVNITNISYNNVNGFVYNGGPNYTVVQNNVVNNIQTFNIVRNTNVRNANINNFRNVRRGNNLVVNAPGRVAVNAGVRPNRIARQIANPRINKGWNVVKNPAQVQQLRQHIAGEAKAGAKVRPFNAKAVQANIRKGQELAVKRKSGAQPGAVGAQQQQALQQQKILQQQQKGNALQQQQAQQERQQALQEQKAKQRQQGLQQQQAQQERQQALQGQKAQQHQQALQEQKAQQHQQALQEQRQQAAQQQRQEAIQQQRQQAAQQQRQEAVQQRRQQAAQQQRQEAVQQQRQQQATQGGKKKTKAELEAERRAQLGM